MYSGRNAVVAVSMLLVFSGVGWCDTYTIRPDGTGDFPTIQAAIDSATPGDVIELADGTFLGDGNRDVDFHGKAVTVCSSSGDPSVCVVDCQGSAEDQHRGFLFQSGEGPESRLEGVTITRAYLETSAGAAVYCHSSSPTISNCVFADNYSFWFGAAIYCASASPCVVECYFSYNSAGSAAGVHVEQDGWPTLRGCVFVGNSVRLFGGAIRCSGASLLVEGCTFAENVSDLWGGALVCQSADVVVSQCTFRGSSGDIGSAVYCLVGAALTTENSVIAGGLGGEAIGTDGDCDVSLTCCDLWGNEGGDWVGSIADQQGINGNISEDPCFCEPATWDLRLEEYSPCAPFTAPNEECDLIGAWPVGCGVTPVRELSWGAVKSLFRE